MSSRPGSAAARASAGAAAPGRARPASGLGRAAFRSAAGSRGGRALGALVTAVAVAVLASAPARAATVELRVEAAGAPAPLFAAPVTTEPHPVDGGDGSGAHACSGPVGATAAATATGALDDAMRAAGIAWRGNWDPDFRDFFIERIGAYASRAPDEYWSLTVDGAYAPGGCLAALADGDEVRFFFGPLFGGPPPVEGGGGGAAGGGTGSAPGGAGGPAGSGTPGTSTAAPPRPGRLAARATRFLRRHREAAGAPWSRLALAMRGGTPRRDPIPSSASGAGGSRGGAARPSTGRGGASIEAAAAALLCGRFGDLRRDGSLGEDVNATALAAIALARRAPLRARRAVAWLARSQRADGGFGFRRGVRSDVDTTGLAAWALARGGRAAAARRAGRFVASAQAADGGFPSIPGGESNGQSTGLALVALRVSRLGVERPAASGATPLDYLAGLARPDGSVEYAPGSAPTPVWTTAQALLGLLPRGKLLRAGPRAAALP
jgi:hypothetical protein